MRPQCAQCLKARLSGQPKAEQHDIVHFDRKCMLGGNADLHPVQGVACVLESSPDALSDHRIIFDKQDAHGA